VDLEEIARRTDGYSCDDLTNICRDASARPTPRVPYVSDDNGTGMNGMRRVIAGKTPALIRAMRKEELNLPVTASDFDAALARISPSVATTDLERHERWHAVHGSS